MTYEKLPTQYFITFRHPRHLMDDILKKEFNLEFAVENRQTLVQEIWRDREPLLHESKEYSVKAYRSVSDQTALEIIEDDRNFFYLKSNDQSLLEGISNRFRSFVVTFRYKSERNNAVTLEKQKAFLEKENTGYTWFHQKNESDESLCGFAHHKNPEFIEFEIFDDYTILMSFHFTEQGSNGLSDLYDRYRQTSHNTEHGVPSLRKEALANIGAQFSQMLDCRPVMRTFHDLLVAQGMTVWFGRYF